MPYRMEVYSLSEASIPVSQIQACLQKKEIQATIDVDPGEEDCWTAIHLAHKDNGDHIAFVEREVVLPDSLAGQVIAEKISDLGETKPPTAARYLRRFLQRSRPSTSSRFSTRPTEMMVGRPFIPCRAR